MSLDGNEAAFKGKKKGRIYLTSHRVIFVNKDAKDMLQSFGMPFTNLSSVDIDQPMFGANAIKGQVKSLPGGNWNGTATFRFSFSSGGAIEFGQAMLQAAKMASRNPPPPYTPPQTDANIYQAPPPSYMAAQSNLGAFQASRDKFPSAPPPQDVWVTDQPPPYASIYPQMPQAAPLAGGYYAPPQQQGYPPAGYSQQSFPQAPGYPAGSVPAGAAVYPPTTGYPSGATAYPQANYTNGAPASYAGAPAGYAGAPPAYPGKH